MLQDEDLEAESEVDEPESYLELMADAPRDKRIALKDSDILGGFAIAATELGLDPIPSGGLVQKPRAARALLDPAVKCVDVQSMLQAADLFTKPLPSGAKRWGHVARLLHYVAPREYYQ